MATSYRLSRLALTHIEEIVAHTDTAFGEMQTAADMAGLESSFELIVKFPGMRAAVFEVKPGLRRYRYQSHYIFYSEQGSVIGIEAVLHVSRNIRRDLFDV